VPLRDSMEVIEKKNKRLLPGHTKKNVSEGVFICAKYESGKYKNV
jgi:hypothetical protein